MLNINSIQNGIVIDHIKCGMGYEIFKLLELDEADYPVALIMNVVSKKKGKKDMIKIENVFDVDLGIIGALDDEITINIIENEKIIDKKVVELPEEVEDVLHCSNPRCITSTERNIKHRFKLIDKEHKKYKCIYCDHIYEFKKI